MRSQLLRFEDWTSPVPAVDREVISRVNDDATSDAEASPPLLFVPGLGHGAWAFAEHWLGHAATRGFAAHALTPRTGGDLRAHVHDVVQVAASLPRQAVLVGHGLGALVVAHALARYPARAAILAAPVLDGWAAARTALRVNPFGTLPALFGGRLRLSRRQLFGPTLSAELAAGYLSRIDCRPGRDLVGGRPGRDLVGGRPAARPVGNPPTLVVGSPDDRVVTRKSLDRAAARYGGAPLLFPGMGHDLMLDASWSEPLDAILDWLTKELET